MLVEQFTKDELRKILDELGPRRFIDEESQEVNQDKLENELREYIQENIESGELPEKKNTLKYEMGSWFNTVTIARKVLEEDYL